MYVDGDTLFITQEIPGKFRKKLENYTYAAKTRDLIILWGKAIPLTTKEENVIAIPPLPRAIRKDATSYA